LTKLHKPKGANELDADHEVLFLHGGASTCSFSALNLLNEEATAAYTDTGVWGAKALKEAKQFACGCSMQLQSRQLYLPAQAIRNAKTLLTYCTLYQHNTVFFICTPNGMRLSLLLR
jgi:phosphoserine aminotransferase